MPFCWFCHEAAQVVTYPSNYVNSQVDYRFKFRVTFLQNLTTNAFVLKPPRMFSSRSEKVRKCFVVYVRIRFFFFVFACVCMCVQRTFVTNADFLTHICGFYTDANTDTDLHVHTSSLGLNTTCIISGHKDED